MKAPVVSNRYSELDFAAAQDLRRISIDAVACTYSNQPHVASELTRILIGQRWPQNGFVYRLVEEDATIAFTMTTFAGKTGTLLSLYVRGDCQHSGCGSRLLDHVERHCAQRNVSRIELSTPPGSTAFYERRQYVRRHVVTVGELRLHSLVKTLGVS